MIEGRTVEEGRLDDDLLQEACGVVGVIDPSSELPVGQMAYEALAGLQHRGEDAAGILNVFDTPQGVAFQGRRDTGLIASVFGDRGRLNDIVNPGAFASVGHTRWSTSGSGSDPYREAQPFDRQRVLLAQNGNIPDMIEIGGAMGIHDSVTDGDALASAVDYLARSDRADGTLNALHHLLPNLNGGYSLVVADGEALYGVRDPWGTHPLWMARLAIGAHVFASEQPVLQAAGRILGHGGKVVEEHEVAPGEIIRIDRRGEVDVSLIQRAAGGGACALEDVYFARADGTLNGRPVATSRLEMGRILAAECPADADVVIGVPDSGTLAALGYAEKSGIPYMPGLVVNKYAAGRSFIGATPQIRAQKVLEKLRPVPELIRGKRLVVVDDSIVRGTTNPPLVKMLREAGAAEVHMRISSPEMVNPCFSGVAISDPDTLVARKIPDIAERAKAFGLDSLGHLSAEGLAAALGKRIGEFCMACMGGEYPFPVPFPEEQRLRLPITPVSRR
jgi:amidophosphoribosyltransferase